MIFLEDDKNFTETGVANLNDKGAVRYKDMNILVFTSIRDQVKGPIILNETLDRHLELMYVDRLVDWNDFYGTPFTDKIYPPRYCRQEDFGDTEEAQSVFNSWNGITILCPDVPKDLSIAGDLSSMISNRFVF